MMITGRAGVGFEAVNLGQQLVERLLTLVIAAHPHHASAALTDGINLVNENDRGSRLARLLEQVAHAGGAHANEHLDKLGAAGLEECDLGLAGRRFGQERLAGARRPDEQHTLRDMSAELSELLRRLQKLDDLLQFGNGLIRPAHILVCDRDILGLDRDGFALADPKDAAHPSAQPLPLPGRPCTRTRPAARAAEVCNMIHPRDSVGARNCKLHLRFVTVQSAWGSPRGSGYGVEWDESQEICPAGGSSSHQQCFFRRLLPLRFVRRPVSV